MNGKPLQVRWGVVAGLAVACSLLLSADLSAQCAMCRTALTNSAEGQRWSHGINAGVAVLLLAPFTIAAYISFKIFRRQIMAALRRRSEQCGAFLLRTFAPTRMPGA